MQVLQVSTGRLTWWATVSVAAALTALTTFGPLGDRRWEQPELLFVLVTVASAVCIVAATIVIALADRREQAELGLLGAALMAASVMPLVHGLVTPEVLYDDTAAFRAAAFLSLPIAVAVAAPLFAPHTRFGRWASRRWRDWTLLSLLGVFVVASFVVFFPDFVTAPAPSDPLAVVVAVGMVAALGVLSLRQLRFHELGGKPANLVASLSLVLLAVTAMLPLVDSTYRAGFWWMHAAGALGVLGASVGLAVSQRMSRTALDVLAPVLARDPLVAFELGLSPVVHRFISSLEAKDPLTRDHVVRTAELALRVGERFHMSARELRDLGLAAMLHDVGKLSIPDEVLTKPAPLTPDEYERVKQHAVDGAALLAVEPTLASAAPIVRSHHERPDGTGYPDGLVGSDVPLAARIIAVCDAVDAMTHDRQYRQAMTIPMVFAVLRANAGTQWDADVINRVITVLPTMPHVAAFDGVGRWTDTTEVTVPDDLSGLLLEVDLEI